MTTSTSSGAPPEALIDEGQPTAGERGGYRDLTRLAGWEFLPLGFLARYPLAMFTVGVTMLVAWARDSYGEGGLAGGALGLGSAFGAPLIGWCADRYGQRVVVQVVGIVNAIVLLALVGVVKADAPFAAILVFSFLIGLSAPQVGPLARARWISLSKRYRPGHSGSRTLSAAMSWESMADELTFVFGPVAVGAIALLVGDYVPMVVAAVITLIFVTWFAHHPSGMHTERRNEQVHPATHWRALFAPRVAAPILGMLSIGMLFGAMLTAVTAFAGSTGDVAAAGILYGAMGVGSAGTALATGLLPNRFWLPWRWVAGAALSLACALALPFADSQPMILLAMFGVGLGVGPSLVSIFAVASHTAPRGRMTMVMTLVSSGLVTGTAIGAPFAGAVADAAGYSAAFWVVCLATALMISLGLWTSAVVRSGEAVIDNEPRPIGGTL